MARKILFLYTLMIFPLSLSAELLQLHAVLSAETPDAAAVKTTKEILYLSPSPFLTIEDVVTAKLDQRVPGAVLVTLSPSGSKRMT